MDTKPSDELEQAQQQSIGVLSPWSRDLGNTTKDICTNVGEKHGRLI